MICNDRDLLDALSSSDEVRELISSESPKPVLPFVIDQYHVKEPKTLFGHVEEPHAHCARPHHQANELSSNLDVSHETSMKRKSYQIDLEEETPVR